MNLSVKKLFPVGLVVLVLGIVSVVCFYAFAPISNSSESVYLYVDDDDNIDSIAVKLSKECKEFGVTAFLTLARHTEYDKNIRTGRYEVNPSMGSLRLLRNLRNGHQSPMKLTIPSVRTTERLAEELSHKLMLSKEDLLEYLNDNDTCAKYGKDTATVICLFVPNTYEIYWNVSAPKLFARMAKEYGTFWNAERKSKAADLGLKPEEVMTLASIVDEETANNGEKPMVAGMYFNRLCKQMPLQADPTVKFALKDFEIRRIYNNMLKVDSPYNTYVNTGLPPGPIRIPSVAGIDAVLNLVHHDYLYMCAKEDFSGTHNFAVTYAEHLQNAAKYSKALNERGIK